MPWFDIVFFMVITAEIITIIYLGLWLYFFIEHSDVAQFRKQWGKAKKVMAGSFQTKEKSNKEKAKEAKKQTKK